MGDVEDDVMIGAGSLGCPPGKRLEAGRLYGQSIKQLFSLLKPAEIASWKTSTTIMLPGG